MPTTAESAVDATYREVILHTQGCRPCSAEGATCTRGDELRAAHQAARQETRQ